MPLKELLFDGIFINERPMPANKANKERTERLLENLLQTKRRKTIATNDRTIYALDIDNPNQNAIKIIKIITRVK